MSMVRHFNRMSREPVAGPSLGVLNSRLDWVWSSLIQWKVCRGVWTRWLSYLFQTKPFYDSVILWLFWFQDKQPADPCRKGPIISLTWETRGLSAPNRAYGNKKAKQNCHPLRSWHGHSGKQCARGCCQNLPHLAQWKPRSWCSHCPGAARRGMEGHSHHTSSGSITQKTAKPMLKAENPESIYWDRNCC